MDPLEIIKKPSGVLQGRTNVCFRYKFSLVFLQSYFAEKIMFVRVNIKVLTYRGMCLLKTKSNIPNSIMVRLKHFRIYIRYREIN